MTARSDVIAEARRWLATPWRHQACVRGAGADCIGFVAGVALALDIPGARDWYSSAEFRTYSRDPSPVLLLRACRQFLLPIPVAAVQPADIFVMRFASEPQHFALVSEVAPAPYVIHAYAQARKVTEHRVDALWRSRIVSAWRFRGVE